MAANLKPFAMWLPFSVVMSFLALNLNTFIVLLRKCHCISLLPFEARLDMGSCLGLRYRSLTFLSSWLGEGVDFPSIWLWHWWVLVLIALLVLMLFCVCIVGVFLWFRRRCDEESYFY